MSAPLYRCDRTARDRTLRGIVALLCLAPAALLRAAQPVPQETRPPGIQTPGLATVPETQPRPGHETEQQTIAKCLGDMRSPDALVRRRAILILGKYRAPAAQAALVRALSDPDAAIRQSALVSISEHPYMPPAARHGVLALLSDPDVHIRRIASSMLPEVVMGPLAMFFSGGSDLGPVEVPSALAAWQQRSADLATRLNAALKDKDAVVRKNILSVARYVPGILNPERIAACFSDPDRGVRILAVQAYRPQGTRGTWQAAALKPLVHDPDALVRRETARSLGRFGLSGVPFLETLADDSDPGVRVEALRQLAEESVPEAFDKMAKALFDNTIPLEARAGLIPFFERYRNRAAPVLEHVLRDGDTLLKAAAIRLLASFPAAQAPTGRFLRWLNDDSRDLRQAAAMAVSIRREDLDPQQVASFLHSRFPDVRALAVRLAPTLPPDKRGSLLLDACMDDNTGVRQDALREVGILRPPRWLQILTRSLQDPDPSIRRTAVDALLTRRDEAGVRALQEFLKTCTDPVLAAIIRQRFRLLVPRNLLLPLRPGLVPSRPRPGSLLEPAKPR